MLPARRRQLSLSPPRSFDASERALPTVVGDVHMVRNSASRPARALGVRVAKQHAPSVGVLRDCPVHPCAARTRPATTRTPLGAARQIANAESTEQPIATQNASV